MNEEQEPVILKNNRKWFHRAILTFLNVILLLLILALLAPIFHGPKGKPNTPEIVTAKQIGIALFEFNSKYGAYPNDTTVSLVTNEYPEHGYNLSGKSSNALFRQLIASKIVKNEEIFYARGKGTVIPDGDISPLQALKKSEVGFAYISGLTSKDNPSLPLLLAPIIPGTTKFDPKPFKGRAIVLRIDQSVSLLKIREDGQAMLGAGKSLLDPNNGLWNGKTPDIRYPE